MVREQTCRWCATITVRESRKVYNAQGEPDIRLFSRNQYSKEVFFNGVNLLTKMPPSHRQASLTCLTRGNIRTPHLHNVSPAPPRPAQLQMCALMKISILCKRKDKNHIWTPDSVAVEFHCCNEWSIPLSCLSSAGHSWRGHGALTDLLKTPYHKYYTVHLSSMSISLAPATIHWKETQVQTLRV